MKKMSLKTAKSKLWDECKRIVRERYVRKDTIVPMWDCFTCDKLIDEPFKAHTGHFIPSGSCGAFLRYDLRNLRIQCYNCNINLGGNGAEYYKRMVDEVGQKAVDKIFQDKHVSIKADVWWYQGKIEEYKLL